ncbi:MAG: hypothetical protein PF489_13200 [Salinivirgaceae bacterium]|jgi:hypothetical protein|nr:hypothetical protein [Salinivirgaceae bacterium]
MRHLITISIILFFSNTFFGANDIMTLNNEMKFKGEVKRVTDELVVFKAEGTRYKIPASEIFSLEFADTDSRVYRNYLGMANDEVSASVAGKLDAKAFHGKKAGHFILGFLFGPFAMLGTAASNPTPQRGKKTVGLSENKKMFNNSEYLKAYRKSAKGSLIGAEALGWGAWILLILML